MPQCRQTAGLGASMAEEAEGQDTGAEAAASSVDPVAVALALGGSSREKADAFLDDQRALIADQRHHLREQFKQLRLNIWQQRLGVLLRIATGFVGLVVAAGLALMIWNAAHADGLIVESFSVPPDMASRGLTGQVAAAQLLDKLTIMQSQTNSVRAPSSYANNWGDDLKVEIPETGVSITEVYRFLRQWLGNETHISGELYRVPAGIAVTVRTGNDGSSSVTGPEADIAELVQKAAENIYRDTQPYRFATYLMAQGQLDGSIAILKTLAKPNEPALDRAWAYNSWGQSILDYEGPAASIPVLKHSLESYPEFFIAQSVIAVVELTRSQPEAALRDYETALSLSTKHGSEFLTTGATNVRQKFYEGYIDALLGDYHDALQLRKTTFNTQSPISPTTDIAIAEIGEHNIYAARDILANPLSGNSNTLRVSTLVTIRTVMQIDSEAQDWSAVMVQGAQAAALAQKYPGLRTLLQTVSDPLLAFAEARQGNVASAEARISATPADCYDCLIARARVAELEGQHARADWWFARAIHEAPSIPIAYADWGQALLERGNPDSAIAKFVLANEKGPKFADPLEGWGEALMKRNRSDLALAKFTEAEKYAPNWGRLHLKWGEALGYAGQKDEAQKQFALAAGLDLSSADKAELAKVSRG